MDRETRTLLVAGALLVAASAGWTRVRAGGHAPPGALLSSAARSRTPSVALLFSESDCGTLIESLRLWNGPAKRRSLDVRGLVYGPGSSAEGVRRIARGAVLEFPVGTVRSSEADALRASLGYGAEPIMIIMDPRGRVRYAFPLQDLSSPQAREHAVEMAEQLGNP